MQPRYERLNSLSNDSAAMPRTSFTDDENNEEIELGAAGSQLVYHADDEDESIENDRQHASKHQAHSEMGLLRSRFMQQTICTLATILLYLALSICLTFYQKALIKRLKFPLTIVSYHLIIKFFMALLIRSLYKLRTGRSRIQLDCRTSVRKMAPTGIASGIDIGFSNWGLLLVPISLYTMTKSTTIVFILFFAILLGLEKKSWSLVAIVSLIATGLFMFTYKSTQFNLLGFIFILFASLSSGVRWSLAQFVMQKTKLGLHNPLDMIYHMQPWMIASLIPFFIIFEGQDLFEVLTNLYDYPTLDVYKVIFQITFGAMLAFCMEISEFLVLSKTSGLTLSIAGIFKDICQLALAVEINDDVLSLINVLGLIVCLAGICCHLLHKYSLLTQQESLNNFEADLEAYSESGSNTNGMLGNSSMLFNGGKHSAQSIPLLEQSESEDDEEGGNEQSASEVIFDVLKRRDMQR